jgi:single-strand DNA-binding protein
LFDSFFLNLFIEIKKKLMSGVNKVILIGNLGKDPEVRYLDNGVAVANMSIATTENYKNKEGDRVSQTEWHDVVLWRGLAEIAEKYLKKGSSVYIEGKIRTNKWVDKDENTRYKTEILADKLNMLGRSVNSDDNNTPSTEDDLPF